jgi:hypothetical protein
MQTREWYEQTYTCDICTNVNVSQLYSKSCHHHMCCACLIKHSGDKLVQVANLEAKMIVRDGETHPELSFDTISS